MYLVGYTTIEKTNNEPAIPHYWKYCREKKKSAVVFALINCIQSVAKK